MNFDFDVPETDAVLAALRSCAPKRVLNVGNGRGVLADTVWNGVSGAVSKLAPVITTITCPTELREATQTRSDRARYLRALPSALPFPTSYFDTAVCTHVIDHLETPQDREDALAEIARVVRPDGRMVITVLYQNFRFDGFGLPRESADGGEFVHRYYLDEFRRQLEPRWTIERLQGLWIYLPKTYPIYTRLGRAVVYWERALRSLPLSLRYGKLLLAVCRPK